MKKVFLKGILPLLLVAVMCIAQLLPVGAVDDMNDEYAYEITEEDVARSATYLSISLYALAPEMLGVSGADVNSYNFNGTITRENVDRIIWFSIYADIFTGDSDIPLEDYVTEDDELVIPEEVVKTLISNDFSISNPDITLSGLYDATQKAIVISFETLSDAVMTFIPYNGFFDVSQSGFEYAYTGNNLSVSCDFINHDRSHSLRVAMELETNGDWYVSDDFDAMMNIKILSFKVVKENEMFQFKDAANVHVEKSWYLCGAREKTQISDLISQFRQDSIVCFGMEDMDIKTDGFVGTGDVLLLLSDTDQIVDILHVVVKGDINGDGKVTSTDYLQLKSYFRGDTIILPDESFEAADVDNSGGLDSTDYLKIKKHMNGTIDLYAD